MKKSLSRRDFLKTMGVFAAAGLVGGSLVDILQSDDLAKETNTGSTGLSLKQKPINLGYSQIIPDKDVDISDFPSNIRSMEARIARCMRWKPITDAVEDRYNIPRGLLLAMMAQEAMGDPTQPNLPYGKYKYGDGGLGLIHIQAINAHNYGLKTMKRYTTSMRDGNHGKLLYGAIKKTKGNLSDLVELDDRFHPILAIDVAARFLLDCKKRVGSGKDDRVVALSKYSGRPYSGKGCYGSKVLEYWAAVNNITGDKFPKNFSSGVNNHIKLSQQKKKNIKKELYSISVVIGGESGSYEDYLDYFDDSMTNFGLDEYRNLGKYTKPKKNSAQKNRKNDLDSSPHGFCRLRNKNSEGFTIFRYTAKRGDSPLSIARNFNDWNSKNGQIFHKTGNLNVVCRDGTVLRKFGTGDVIYFKAREK